MTETFREVPLEEIVEKEVAIGFRVDGFDWTFDGDEHSGRRKYTISPAGEDAPDVFRVIERGDLGWREYNVTRDYIVSGGREKALGKAYQLALDYATKEVEGRNKTAEREGYRKAILVDKTKKSS